MTQQPADRAFGFLKVNPREAKPRGRGVTEIRGPDVEWGRDVERGRS